MFRRCQVHFLGWQRAADLWEGEGEGTASPKIGLVKKLYKLDLALHQIAHNNTWALDY